MLKRLALAVTRLSLRQQVALFTAVALVLILLGLALVMRRATHEAGDRILAERLGATQLLAHALDHELEEVSRDLKLSAAGAALDFADNDPEPEREMAEHAFQHVGHLAAGTAILDAQGVVREVAGEAPHRPGDNLAPWDAVQRTLDGSGTQVDTCYGSSASFICITEPLPVPGGRPAGVIMAYLDLTAGPLEELLDLAPPLPAYLNVVDADGSVLASSAAQDGLQSADQLATGKAHVRGLIAQRQAATGTCYSCHDPGGRTPEVMATAPLTQAPWAVLIREPEASFRAPVNDLRRNFLIAGAVALAAVMGMSLGGMSLLTWRLGVLGAASRRIAGGDLATPAPALGQDEVGALGQDFEAMRRELKAARDGLEERVRERTATLERRTRELSALYAIDKAAVAAERQQEVLDAALTQMLAALETDNGVVYLARDEEILEVVAARGCSEEFLAPIRRRKAREGIPGLAVLQGRAVATDIAHHPSPALVQHMTRAGLAHFAAAPMLVGERLLGTIITARRQDVPFSQQDLDLMQSVASQLAMSLERFRLQQALEARAERRAAINRIGRAISSSLDMSEIYSTLDTELARVVSFDRLSIGLLTPEGDAFDILQPGASPQMPARRKLEDTPMGKVIRTGQPEVRQDIASDTEFSAAPEYARSGFRSSITVPLTVKGKVLGTVNLFSRDVSRYSKADLETLQPIADHLATALENARLYQEARESIHRLEFLSEKLAERHTELQGAYEAATSALLAMLESRYPYFRGRRERVRHYCRSIALKLGMSREDIAVLDQAAQLHDLGIIAIPESILDKEGPLDPPEMAQVRLHPEKSVELLRQIPTLEQALPIIKHHHERCDGLGYPDGLAGEGIPLGARVLAVADAYDAMTSQRPHHPAHDHEAALAELRKGAGNRWDQRVVAALAQALEEERLA